MKKEQKKVTLDRYGNEINSLEESMHYISCRLDELTGNAMGNSYLKLDIDPVDLSRVENELEQLQIGVSNINSTLEDIHSNRIETNSTLELILMQLTRIADSLENNKK